MTDEAKNVLVLTIFAGSVVAVIVGYLTAWRSKRTVFRRAGSLMVAAVTGFAGLVIAAWLVTPFLPLPHDLPLWESLLSFLILFLVFSPLPVGAFYLCAKFMWRSYRTNEIENTAQRLTPEIMRGGSKHPKYRREITTMLISCVVCALAWWWDRSSTWWMNSNPSGSERLYPWMASLTEVLNFPGWLVVKVFDPRESPAPPATKLTDTLIPILSALFWTWLALLLVKLWMVFRGYVHKPAKS